MPTPALARTAARTSVRVDAVCAAAVDLARDVLTAEVGSEYVGEHRQTLGVADRLVEDKVTLVPTLVLHETFSRLDDPALAQSDVYKAVPDSEMAKWNVPGMIARAGWKPEDFAAFRASRANQDLFVRLFRAAGGRVVAGSDAANQMLVPGASLIREIELLVQVGFTPADALLSATRDAAALLNADSLGALVQGRKADLIVLSRDPTVDIANLRTVEQVMVRGHLMSADSLRRHW